METDDKCMVGSKNPVNEYHQNPKQGRKRKYFRFCWGLCSPSCILISICAALLVGIIAAIILVAILIKPATKTTTTVTTVTTATTTTTTTVTTATTTVTTTITATPTTATTTTTIAASPCGGGPSTSGSSWSATETIALSCSTSLTNLTIIITVQKTIGASGTALWNNFPGVLSGSYVNTATQIIYTWTTVNGQTIPASSSYTATVQFSLTGTAHPTSNDTYIITTTISSGQTNTLTGHF